jgi:hypothetical protein
MSNEKYINCVEACNNCAMLCDHCSCADLKEEDVKQMIHCINLNRECSAFCRNAVHIMNIDGRFTKEICLLCAIICEACAEECEKHTHLEHCRLCALNCRECAEECRKVAA